MERQSFLQRMLNVFLNPTKAFDDIAKNVTWQDWVWPLVLISVVLALVPRLYQDIKLSEALTMIQKQERSIMDNPNVPEDRKADIQKRFDKARGNILDAKENPWKLKYIWGIILFPVYLFVFVSIFAGLLMLIGNFGLGEKARFFQVFTVVVLSYYIGGNGAMLQMPEGIGVLETIVKTPLILAKQSSSVYLSPGLFMENTTTFLGRFMNQLDVFRLWSVAVLGIGFAKIYRRPFSTGIWTVGTLWLVLTALGAGLSGLIPGAQ
ncbi:MAG: hypothetical protein K9N11_01250 [Lentisphaeria bacterium]|nr:hypothetical protein [Candidatus Neomarinimicrobiota bacterium]MCF7841454.1 hypothetical protein [Lentisphaeria bacterium]